MAPPQTNYSKFNIVIPDTPNTRIFTDLFRTDPSATKPFQKEGGYKGTSIDPAWRWMRLTEYFGPCGQGWGAEQLAFVIEEGVAFVCVRLWYRQPNEDGTMGSGEQCWTAPQWGGTKLIKVDGKGKTTINDEALKSAMTDAMGKCAGMFLGLGADIYLGSFEDDKYREESELLYTAKANPELTPPAIARFEADLKKKLDGVADLGALDDLWRGGVNARIREIGTADKSAQQRLISAFSAKKNELLKRDQDPDATPEQSPAIQEEADGDQETITAETVAREAKPDAVPETSRQTPAEDTPDAPAERSPEITPEKIQQFETWSKGRLETVNTQKEFVALWLEADKRLTAIEAVDKTAHDRIKGLYAACQERIRSVSKTRASDRKILGQDNTPQH